MKIVKERVGETTMVYDREGRPACILEPQGLTYYLTFGPVELNRVSIQHQGEPGLPDTHYFRSLKGILIHEDGGKPRYAKPEELPDMVPLLFQARTPRSVDALVRLLNNPQQNP